MAKLAWRSFKSPTVLRAEIELKKYEGLKDETERGAKVSKSVLRRGMMWGYKLLDKGFKWDRTNQTDQQHWWNLSTKGLFTTKSAYELNRQLEGAPEVEQVWKEVWRFKGPTRGSLMLWTTTHDRLKTKMLLRRHNICETPRCEICGGQYETTLHAPRDCSISSKTWQLLLPKGGNVELGTMEDVKEWMLLNLQMSSRFHQENRQWRYIFRQGVLDFWFWRNMKLFYKIVLDLF